jgi:succinate dehydrogenase hydrophobic anchor subunit
MSVKGFFIAIACTVAGAFGLWYGIQKVIETEGSVIWIAILVISFIAVFFGMGVFSSRIKL